MLDCDPDLSSLLPDGLLGLKAAVVVDLGKRRDGRWGAGVLREEGAPVVVVRGRGCPGGGAKGGGGGAAGSFGLGSAQLHMDNAAAPYATAGAAGNKDFR